MQRRHIEIIGVVQGVGFRPFVHRQATALQLSGWVQNSGRGVNIEIEGPEDRLDRFALALKREAPPLARIFSFAINPLPLCHDAGFTIRHSEQTAVKDVPVLPDIAVCAACRQEILDPRNRRFQYPFTNCTQCGPRFSIIQAVPYDRQNTTMRTFTMCRECRDEYQDPGNRRFHAQPNACPACGPQLFLWDRNGRELATREDALARASEAIRQGYIVAVKGVGGVHLCADAGNDTALKELRQRKGRTAKPFAVMLATLDDVRTCCKVSVQEAEMLQSPAAPIVLLARHDERPGIKASPLVAPDNPDLGVMLAYSPLHVLLLAQTACPLVVTSGNISEEPICFEELDVIHRLGSLADMFLLHDRPIVRPLDDSVVRSVAGRSLIIRRSRGYTPLPVSVPGIQSGIMGAGGQQKNTVACTVNDHVYLSQHIGNLDNWETVKTFRQATCDLPRLYDTAVRYWGCDRHPDYHATQAARQQSSCFYVQHHHAHIVACMAEHRLDHKVLGVAWDGTGLGEDNMIWGGEFLVATRECYTRRGHLYPFRLPGGEAAIKDPRRSAVGVLYAVMGQDLFANSSLQQRLRCGLEEWRVWQSMLERGTNAPLTTSAGRLFDAVAGICGLSFANTFEGQAAMAVEFAARRQNVNTHYAFPLESSPPGGSKAAHSPHKAKDDEAIMRTDMLIADWRPMIRDIVADCECMSASAICSKFQESCAQLIVTAAKLAAYPDVVLSGGCFQNGSLLGKTREGLQKEGFRVYCPEAVPPNDEGLSLGQAVVVDRLLKQR